MSDSVDRVFVHALQTVRRLPRTGSSRPPPSSRLRLYGLYKQSMEGDVLSILPRPTLPPSSPDPASTTTSALNRYASKDLRAREAQAEVEKWDAWHACSGMSRTQAKREYITTLIETMKMYASGTVESRELVGELEFVWGQIRSQSGSSGDEEDGERERERESPTRKLERAGLKEMESYASIPPGVERIDSRDGRGDGKMRMLSPMSQHGSGEVVEGEEEVNDGDDPALDRRNDEDDNADNEDFRDARDGSEIRTHNRKWRRQIESALSKMTAEIAALREAVSESTVYSTSVRRRHSIISWLRWLLWTSIRQLLIQLAFVLLCVIWGRWRGDRRAEEWVRRRWKEIRPILGSSNLKPRFGWPVLLRAS